jgi:hypothetical protein
MKSTHICLHQIFSITLTLTLILILSSAQAASPDAKNFITIATGVVASNSDTRIPMVNRQFSEIESYCARTSSGAAIWDKLAKGHSLMTTHQSLLLLLSDFVRVARASCSKFDDTTLISLYVLERNAGNDHTAVINRLITNPGALVRKYGSKSS